MIKELGTIGINGFGRIGKLLLWYFVGQKNFKEIVVNLGRKAGISLADVAHYIERDSTYGWLHTFLFGNRAKEVIGKIYEQEGIIEINGVSVRFLRKNRKPADIGWDHYGVRLVVDATGSFLDPSINFIHPSLRGHFDAGADKVIISAPFKTRGGLTDMPEDCVTTVMGINADDYNPSIHKIISSASCTTTCLAHMIKPLLDYFDAENILSAFMTTIHAATSKQEVLDRLPAVGVTDLRKNRSVMNNIILTTTGAADTLRLVVPEMATIPFLAESVRIPITTGSLIILVVNLSDKILIGRDVVNNVYRMVAKINREYLVFSEKQNVSSDIIGYPKAVVIIEGSETHTITTGQLTQAVVYGWYDNEYGSYVNMLGDRVVSIAEDM